MNYIRVLYLWRAAARLQLGSLQGQVGIAVLGFRLEEETGEKKVMSSHMNRFIVNMLCEKNNPFLSVQRTSDPNVQQVRRQSLKRSLPQS